MNQVQHNAEVTKVQDEIAKAQEDLNAENARMVTERAKMDAKSQRMRAEAFRLSLDQDASNDVLRRRHQTRLPLHYEPMNLFNTPGQVQALKMHG